MKKEIFSKLKKIRLKQIIYPSIITVFLVVVIILLISSIKFLSQNINKIFSPDTDISSSQLLKVDLDRFYFVAKRLGISIEPETAPPMTPPLQIEPAPPPAELNKTSLKISVLNSAKIKGLAKNLKDSLETEGFSVENIGNTSPSRENTIVKIKESKEIYASLIKEVISQQYTLGDDEILGESENFDVIIIIGEQ